MYESKNTVDLLVAFFAARWTFEVPSDLVEYTARTLFNIRVVDPDRTTDSINIRLRNLELRTTDLHDLDPTTARERRVANLLGVK